MRKNELTFYLLRNKFMKRQMLCAEGKKGSSKME